MHSLAPVRRRHLPALALLCTVLLAQIAGLFAGPQSTAKAAISADPSEEIVYIDSNGVIRVLDTQGSPLVQWFSPTGEWEDIALGDFDGDGDMEIAAIGGTGGIVRIGIFDPVVGTGAVDPTKEINGIPWEQTYEDSFPGNPDLIAAGDFDANIKGADEVAYGYKDETGRTTITVLNATKLQPNGKPSGRDWKVHVTKRFDDAFTFMTNGDINSQGSEDIAVIGNRIVDGEDESYFDIYEVDNNFRRIDGKKRSDGTYRKLAIGQIIEGGPDEVAVVRSAKAGNSSWWVYKIDEDTELATDEEGENAPNPGEVFLADINGNGDKEVFFLRDNQDDRVRLFMINEWGDDKDDLPNIELRLDEDNGYEVGAGGDIDGDLRDEIIIMRNDNIRVYTRPESSVGSDTISDYQVSTNRKGLAIGDLDQNGFVSGPQFATNVSTIQDRTPAGTRSGTQSVTIQTLSGENVPYFVVQNLPSWVIVSNGAGTTPGQIGIAFDATNLAAGTYRHTLSIDSTNQNVLNRPIQVQLEVVVEAPALSLTPNSASFIYFPCPDPGIPGTLEPQEIVLQVGGTTGLQFRAAVIEVPQVDVAQSQTPLASVSGGAILENGDLEITDINGNTARIPMQSVNEAAVSATEIEWPTGPSWVTSVRSLTTTVPTTITVEVNPAAAAGTLTLPAFKAQLATLVVVADTRAGLPPDNVHSLPISLMCAQQQLALPVIRR